MFKKVKLQEKLLFTQQIATTIKSGLSLIDSLTKIAKQTNPGVMRDVIVVILADVREGKTLANAMKKHPYVFDNYYVGLIQLGEETGNWDDNLNSLTEQIKKDYQLSQETRSQAFSHFILLGGAIGIMAVFFTFFI